MLIMANKWTHLRQLGPILHKLTVKSLILLLGNRWLTVVTGVPLARVALTFVSVAMSIKGFLSTKLLLFSLIQIVFR